MDERIAATLKIIAQDIRTAPKPQNLAIAVGLSPSRFYNLFRRETGTAPASYIRTLRYHKARELLVYSRLSIKEITCLVGFNDLSHFVRDFQKIYGASPATYRHLYPPIPFQQDHKGRQ